jgi:hypothetical protein
MLPISVLEATAEPNVPKLFDVDLLKLNCGAALFAVSNENKPTLAWLQLMLAICC